MRRLVPTDQDGAIAGAAKEAGRGIIVAANKWDLMKEQGEDARQDFDENLRYQLKFLDFAPILHISAVTGERTPKLLEVVDKSPPARARACRPASSTASSRRSPRNRPGHRRNRNVRVMYAAQTSVAPPTFVLFTNAETSCTFPTSGFSKTGCANVRIFRQPDSIQARPAGIARTGAPAPSARRSAEAGEKRAGLKAHERPRARRPRHKARRKRSTKHARQAQRGAKRGAKRGKALQRGWLLSRLDGYTSIVAAPKRELFKAAEVCEVVQLQP